MLELSFRSSLTGFIATVAVYATVSFAGAPRAYADGTPNACGCYQDTTGACFCGKKSKCGCPGQCEPKGCEEKRAKQLEKEIAEETKKATAGGASAGKAKEKAKEKEAEGEGEAEEAPKKKARSMTAGQKKELLKLLDAYVAEHPEGKGRTVEEVRSSLGGE